MRANKPPECFCLSRLATLREQKMGPVRLKALSFAGQLPGSSVFHVRVPARSRHDMIYHRRTREWFMVTKGRGRGIIGGRRVTFKPGVIVYMPPGVPHQMMTEGEAMEALVIFSPPLALSGPKADLHRV